jgi:hypothetical protein
MIRILALLLVVVGGITGCSQAKPVGAVTGRVTFQKKAVDEGKILFFNPKLGIGAEFPLGPDGSYVVKNAEGGLPPGDYIVLVTPLVVMVPGDRRTPAAPEEKKSAMIPEKYRRQGSSTLKATVAAGENKLDFDMTP